MDEIFELQQSGNKKRLGAISFIDKHNKMIESIKFK